MKLSEKEGVVMNIAGIVKDDGLKKISLCLVGKLLTSRFTNRDAFRSLIARIWRTTQAVEVENVLDQKQFEEPATLGNHNFAFGSWMRASSPEKVRPTGSNPKSPGSSLVEKLSGFGDAKAPVRVERESRAANKGKAKTQGSTPNLVRDYCEVATGGVFDSVDLLQNLNSRQDLNLIDKDYVRDCNMGVDNSLGPVMTIGHVLCSEEGIRPEVADLNSGLGWTWTT
ncbi:hypothetical protein JRO89_XS15G0090700 [Xanthoceras sorbifolium]|uniref:Uncharacterized protein n=1 Tax=Xanthoceras sorbifolium TaxID=99658 RepID=A0ABQ8H1F5_9ROSI|nr:hypothetical protein JRO89_XS15G0090700 [Xanthoceras sorbifolium]